MLKRRTEPVCAHAHTLEAYTLPNRRTQFVNEQA